MVIREQIDSALLARLEEIEQRIIEKISTKQVISNTLLIGDPQQNYLLQHCRCQQDYLFSSYGAASHQNTINRLCLGKIDQLPYAKESMDLVILPHTLEFLAEACTLLDEIMPILSKKGLLLLFAFSRWNYLSIKKNPFHSFFEIKKALLQAGLSITITETYFSLFTQLSPSRTGKFLDKILAPYSPFLCSAYFILAQALTLPITPSPFRFLVKPTLGLALENNKGCSM